MFCREERRETQFLLEEEDAWGKEEGSEHPAKCLLFRGLFEVTDAEMRFKQCEFCEVANHHSPWWIL